MTDLKKMGTLTEHANTIRDAIKASRDAGLTLEATITHTSWGDEIAVVEIDLWSGDSRHWINVYTEERL